MPFPRQSLELVGHLGRDAEMRYTPQGSTVTQFSLAVTRQWKQGGQEMKETIWVNCSVWGKLAEACAHLQKGQQVLVKGYLKPDAATGSPRLWSRTDGGAGASYDLTAQEVWLSLFGKQGGTGEHASQAASPGDYPDEDIPF